MLTRRLSERIEAAAVAITGPGFVLGTSVLLAIANAVYSLVSGGGFGSSLAMVVLVAVVTCDTVCIIQMNLSMMAMKSSAQRLEKQIKLGSSIAFPDEKSVVDRGIEDVLASGRVTRAKVICYGSNSFGRLIDRMASYHPEIVSLEVVFADPDAPFLAKRDDDKSRINANIESICEKVAKANESLPSGGARQGGDDILLPDMPHRARPRPLRRGSPYLVLHPDLLRV